MTFYEQLQSRINQETEPWPRPGSWADLVIRDVGRKPILLPMSLAGDDGAPIVLADPTEE